MAEQQKAEPSQVTGQLTSAQGQVYQAVGAVLPESMGASGWTESGAQLQKQGEAEVQAAKVEKQVDATMDSASAKLKTATGYLTGNQEKQTEGNMEAEKASWEYKQASSDKPLDIPIPSAKGVEGKVESVVGMVTGDAEKQKQGNVKAENAAWTDGN